MEHIDNPATALKKFVFDFFDILGSLCFFLKPMYKKTGIEPSSRGITNKLSSIWDDLGLMLKFYKQFLFLGSIFYFWRNKSALDHILEKLKKL